MTWLVVAGVTIAATLISFTAIGATLIFFGYCEVPRRHPRVDPDPEFCAAVDRAYQAVIAPHFPVGSPLGPRLDDQPAEVIQARADALRRQP